jgi:hypothetical protein
MGTSYGTNPATGRWALDCGQCGVADGTVRKRRCPADNYCPAAQLCPSCYAAARRDGQWAEWHRDCARGKAAYEAELAARAAAPDRYARSAWGDWHGTVPAGMVGVVTHAGSYVMLPKDEYQPSAMLPASVLPWGGPG